MHLAIKIIFSVVLLLILSYLLLKNTYFCEGGFLLKGCNKILFPWTKKKSIGVDKKHLCMTCYKREMEVLDGIDLSDTKPRRDSKQDYRDLPFKKEK